MDIGLAGILMGVMGTLAMDIWAYMLDRAGVAARPNWAMPGRWLGHIPKGRVFHDDIGEAAEIPHELRLGWALHYGTGIVYGLVFALFAGADWLAEPTFWPLWVYSIATIAAGWFLLLPGMGLGWAGAKTDEPNRLRIMGLIAHTVFALGMGAGAVMVG